MSIPRITEIAQISAIIADNICEELYEYNNSHSIGGYIYTTMQIAEWAVDFYYQTSNIDWEDREELIVQLNNSNAILKGCCWDDFIIDFANKKLEEYKK